MFTLVCGANLLFCEFADVARFAGVGSAKSEGDTAARSGRGDRRDDA